MQCQNYSREYNLASHSILRKLHCEARIRNLLVHAINAAPTGSVSFDLLKKKCARHLTKVNSRFSSHIFALLSIFVKLCDIARHTKVVGVSF